MRGDEKEELWDWPRLEPSLAKEAMSSAGTQCPSFRRRDGTIPCGENGKEISLKGGPTVRDRAADARRLAAGGSCKRSDFGMTTRMQTFEEIRVCEYTILPEGALQ